MTFCDEDLSDSCLLSGESLRGDGPDSCWRHGCTYSIVGLLGRGAFGCVYHAIDLSRPGHPAVAIKSLRDTEDAFGGGIVELCALMSLSSCSSDSVVRIIDHFFCNGHLCIVEELLGENLLDLFTRNEFRGLPVDTVRSFAGQILAALVSLESLGIVHGDLKVENLVLGRPDPSRIVLVDFGSSAFEGSASAGDYIQARHYRSPEVLLGLPYSCAVDCWSLGAIVAELALGTVLFPGADEYDQVAQIVQMIGVPSAEMISRGKHSQRFFKQDGGGRFVLKSPAEYERESGRRPANKGRRFFSSISEFFDKSLTSLPSDEKRPLSNFIQGLLALDPSRRWTASQALHHPFISKTPFTGEFVPPPHPARTHALKDFMAVPQNCGTPTADAEDFHGRYRQVLLTLRAGRGSAID